MNKTFIPTHLLDKYTTIPIKLWSVTYKPDAHIAKFRVQDYLFGNAMSLWISCPDEERFQTITKQLNQDENTHWNVTFNEYTKQIKRMVAFDESKTYCCIIQ